MRRVNKELGPGVWEEPAWRSEPYRDPRLAKLIQWHDLRLNFHLLEDWPGYTREWWLEHDISLDAFLKIIYSAKRIVQLYYAEHPLLSLIPKRSQFA